LQLHKVPIKTYAVLRSSAYQPIEKKSRAHPGGLPAPCLSVRRKQTAARARVRSAPLRTIFFRHHPRRFLPAAGKTGRRSRQVGV